MSEDAKVLVEFKNVDKRFGGGKIVVMDDFSFNFMKGETHIICGRSGAGKSTLIRCINALETIDKGSIIVEGEELNHKTMHDIRKKVAMVFQDFNLFPHMTVLENVTFGPVRSLKMKKEEAAETGLMYLERVGLRDRADAKPA